MRPFCNLQKLFHKPSFVPRSSLNLSFGSVGSCTRSTRRGLADLSRSPSPPRVFPGSGWDNIDPSFWIEEESIPTYRPEKFYPVRIGEVFNDRYQVVGKLGYASSATLWLCRDLL